MTVDQVTTDQTPDLRLVGETSRLATEDFHRLVVRAFEEIALAACSDEVTLDNLLRLVGRRLCELLGVTRCSVYLRREDGQFQGQVGYCAGAPSIDARVSRLVSGVDSFTAEIVRSSAPVVVHDASKDPRTIQRTMRQWRVQDMLGVPLVVDAEVIGIIYVDDQARTHDFTERDIALAQAFAGLSAFAVKQTWQWERLLRQARAADRERRVLDRASEVRTAVTRALISGADVDDVLRLASELLRKPVVLYNSRFEPLAWSTPQRGAVLAAPTLTRERSEHPHVAPLVAKLLTKDGSVAIRATPELRCRRLLARLAVDEETLGFIELYELGTGLEPADGRVLEELASALALKIRLDQRFGTRETVGRMDFFVDLLFGRREPAVLTSRAPSFDVDPERAHVVLAIPHADDDGAEALGMLQALAEDVESELDGLVRLVEHVPTTGHHLALFELDASPESRTQLRPRLEDAVRALDGVHAAGLVVFTDLCSNLGDLPEAVRQAIGVADLLDAHPVDGLGVAFAQDLELLRLVSQGGSLDEAVRSSQRVLRPLVDHDTANGGDLVQTLRAFIDCGAQFRATAARLAVHENTVRYRLHRICEISSIDPANFQDLTRAQFAFQVARLAPSAGRPARRTPALV